MARSAALPARTIGRQARAHTREGRDRSTDIEQCDREPHGTKELEGRWHTVFGVRDSGTRESGIKKTKDEAKGNACAPASTSPNVAPEIPQQA